jgi:hypothetical protein
VKVRIFGEYITPIGHRWGLWAIPDFPVGLVRHIMQRIFVAAKLVT